MKTILLTGATDGIGLETAKQLVSQGHQVLLHGRSEEKLRDMVKVLKAISSEAKIQTYRADLSNFVEIKSMLEMIVKSHQQIDVIINNAGVFKAPQTTTADGLDLRFVVNTFAPYIITKKLLPLLASDGRIINLSSAAQAPIDLDAMAGKRVLNDDFQAYAQSKLAITIWSQQMATQLTPNQVIVAVNPGSMLASKMVKEGFGVKGNDLNIGSDILVKAALSEEFLGASGHYFDNDSQRFALPHLEAQDQTKCSQIMNVIDSIIERSAH
ncbi:MAG: SDR family NAD(P)-dependent oxidoreductase [Kangiellaceae bacterium]